MTTLTLIANATTATLPEPVAKPTSRTGQRESTLRSWSVDPAQAGVWECEPGEFTTVRDGFHEVCQILSGCGALAGDDGRTVELTAGSMVVIPDGWRGVWHVYETMRKTYVTVSTARGTAIEGTSA